MSDWAEDKAREWLVKSNLGPRKTSDVDSLAALLREVALSEWGENAALRAEQTKVAEKLQDYIAMWKAAEAKLARCVEALGSLIRSCEEHDAAVAAVAGRPINWKDAYLDDARAALAAAKGKP